MDLSLPRPHLVRSLSFLLVVALAAAPILVSAQTEPTPPLQRRDADSSITQGTTTFAPADLVASDEWILGGTDLEFVMSYLCLNAAGNPDNDCEVGGGSGTLDSIRQAFVHYTLDGSTPTQDNESVTLASGSQLPTNRNPVTVSGSLPAAAFADLTDGQNLTFRINVPLTNSDLCTNPCWDPDDDPAVPYYRVRVDDSVPGLVVTDPSNANVHQVTPQEWWMWRLNHPNTPTISLAVFDDPAGSPLQGIDDVQFLIGGETKTTCFDPSPVSNHSFAFFHQPGQPGCGGPFNTDDAVAIDVRANDTAGHIGTSRVWVVSDTDTPTLDASASFLKRHGNADGLASLGEPLRIYVNATDIADTDGEDDLATPPSALTVTVRLQGGIDNATVSSPVVVPWNETACTGGCYFHPNVTIPDPWVNGVAFANVTVTDPAGNVVSGRIMGNISVDTSLPVIDPRLPIDTTRSTTFTKDPRVVFRARVTDASDEDPWNDGSPDDTDGFGIQLDSVKVRYKIGRDGVLQTGTMSPQTAEDIFEWVNTFDGEDQVYYFIEAKDLAGNTKTYPGPSDPAVTLPGAQNGGRFLFAQVDLRGPVIEPATDLAFVGPAPHEFRFKLSDGGVGVDPSTARMFYRNTTSGTFQEVALSQGGKTSDNATLYTGTVPAQPDETRIQYYVTVEDTLANRGTLGSADQPRTATVDLSPPVVTVTAPETATEARFNVTWSATDKGSGFANFTLQFRIAPGGDWFTVPSREETTETFYNVCAATGKTYEFRVHAFDKVGNERVAEGADATTFVDAATSCAQSPEVSISAPDTGDTLSGAIEITYSAVSTTAPGQLDVRIEIGTGSSAKLIRSGLSDTGTFTWQSRSQDLTVPCVEDGQHTIRVIASDPNGLEGTASVGPVTLQNGIVDCNDRDSDGLPDAWEMQHFGNLDNDGGDDADGDNFSNVEEWQANTDPNDSTSRPTVGGNGNGLGVSIAGWDNMYILVILAFAAILAVFAIGMTRRW